MRLLIDTHILLWTLADSPKLSAQAREIMTSASSIYVSSASYWELAIKVSLGKLNIDLKQLRDTAERDGIEELPVNGEHAIATLSLAHHHKDPFDRLIIATAISEPMKLLTADSVVAQYTELAILI